jgi:integration host factor subunit beta
MDRTKSNLIEAVALKGNLPIIKAEALVNEIFDGMREALLRGEGIEVRGFGSFTLREYGAYVSRNPRTGEPVHVPKKRVPFFRVGKKLRVRVNSAHADRPPTP